VFDSHVTGAVYVVSIIHDQGLGAQQLIFAPQLTSVFIRPCWQIKVQFLKLIYAPQGMNPFHSGHQTQREASSAHNVS